VFPIPSISYVTIVLLVSCASLFAEAAEQEGRPRILGAIASLGAWYLFTSKCFGGTLGGLISQVLLIAVWGGLNLFSDWLKERRDAKCRR
jgi:hypothetical protein